MRQPTSTARGNARIDAHTPPLRSSDKGADEWASSVLEGSSSGGEGNQHFSFGSGQDKMLPTSMLVVIACTITLVVMATFAWVYWRFVIHRQTNISERSEEATPNDLTKRESPKARREKILSYYQRYTNLQTQLTSEDISENCDNRDEFDIELGPTSTQHEDIVLPSDNQGKPTLTRESSCAICMEKYEASELIVHSSSSSTVGCPHVFHKHCFIDYLVAYRGDDGYGSPCPTCRQPYCGKDIFIDSKDESNQTTEKAISSYALRMPTGWSEAALSFRLKCNFVSMRDQTNSEQSFVTLNKQSFSPLRQD